MAILPCCQPRSAARGGISAGLRAQELDLTFEVTLLVDGAYPDFCTCGLPSTCQAMSPTGARWLTQTTTWSRLACGCCWTTPPSDGSRGPDLDGVHVLHTMGDTFALHHALTGATFA